MDIRSFSINYETNLVVYDETLTRELEADFEADLERCVRFSVDGPEHAAGARGSSIRRSACAPRCCDVGAIGARRRLFVEARSAVAPAPVQCAGFIGLRRYATA